MRRISVVVLCAVECRDVPGFPGYQASNDGFIYSFWRKTKKRLQSVPDKDGYLRLTLVRDGQHVNCYVHVLILIAFSGPCPKGCQTRHLNGIESDNRPENLVWGTPKENAADRRRHGTQRQGSGHKNAVLTELQVAKIRSSYDGKRGSKMQLARRFGVSHRLIRNVLNGVAWTHVT